jgi:hypothetical protein
MTRAVRLAMRASDIARGLAAINEPVTAVTLASNVGQLARGAATRLEEVVRYLLLTTFMLADVAAIGALPTNKPLSLQLRPSRKNISEIALLADIQKKCSSALTIHVRVRVGQYRFYVSKKRVPANIKDATAMAVQLAPFNVDLDAYEAAARVAVGLDCAEVVGKKLTEAQARTVREKVPGLRINTSDLETSDDDGDDDEDDDGDDIDTPPDPPPLMAAPPGFVMRRANSQAPPLTQPTPTLKPKRPRVENESTVAESSDNDDEDEEESEEEDDVGHFM